jgi:hypothetical protein
MLYSSFKFFPLGDPPGESEICIPETSPRSSSLGLRDLEGDQSQPHANESLIRKFGTKLRGVPFLRAMESYLFSRENASLICY